MKKAPLLSSAFFALTVLFTSAVQAQEGVPSRIEVGIQFSSTTYPGQTLPGTFGPSPGATEAGLGGRITFNLNKNIALEAEENYFPHHSYYVESRGGALWQGHFGLKVGKRFGKFGIFAKARPGFASFSGALKQVDTITLPDSTGQPVTYPVFSVGRTTHFAMDLGGVIEFYPSRKVLTRIDVGDTIIHYGRGSFFPTAISGALESRTTHNLQVSAGIGFRFGSLPPEETTATVHNEKLQRFEVGAQFSSLGYQQVEHDNLSLVLQVFEFRDVKTQAGFGGRFTFNLTRNFALEAQGDFYPYDNPPFLNNGRAGGSILQTQAGIKAGKRFEKFGIFGKARPGVVSFSKGIEVGGLNQFGFPVFQQTRRTHFSMDVGGVLEFYPTRRIVTRFDGGDTMIFYRGLALPIFFFPARNYTAPSETIHNFQFSAGVGFRF